MTEKALEGVRFNKKSCKKSLRLWKKIASQIQEGKTVTEILRMPGMPDASTYYRWLATETGFQVLIRSAKLARAGVSEDKILDIANKSHSKDEAAGARVQLDAHKWIAEVNDPDRYGKRVTHAGDKNNPVQFIVSTGFPEPNEHQRPPKIGADGLIEKNSGAIAPQFHEEEGP